MNKEMDFIQFSNYLINLSNENNHKEIVLEYVRTKTKLLEQLSADEIKPDTGKGVIVGTFKRDMNGSLLAEEDHTFQKHSFEKELQELITYQFETEFYNTFNEIDENLKELFIIEVMPQLLDAKKQVSKSKYFENFSVLREAISNTIQRLDKLKSKKPQNRGGRPATFDRKKTQKWWSELVQNSDYLNDGTPIVNKIVAEIIKRHKIVTGQSPSEETIDEHRRKLKLMLNKG